MEVLLGLQFGRAIGAPGHVLLELMPSVIRQLAVNVKHDIFANPFTLHSSPSANDSTGGAPCLANFCETWDSHHLMSARAPRSFCVARKSVFLAVSSVVCKISPTVL